MRAYPRAGRCHESLSNDCRWVRSRCRLRSVPSLHGTSAAASLDVPTALCRGPPLYQPAAPVASTSAPTATAPRASTSATASGGVWAIQVGAFSDPVLARAIATGVHDALADLLTTAQIELLPTTPFGGKIVYRARLGNLSANAANAACARLAANQQPCMVVAPAQDVVASPLLTSPDRLA